MEEINLSGAILSVDERDIILGGEFNINDLPNIKTREYEYNQNEFASEFGYCLCTCYAGIGMYADNINIDIVEDERKQLATRRVNLPDFDKNIGGYLSEGINDIRKFYKEKGLPISSIRINTGSEDFKKVLDKGYRINIGMVIKDDYIKDTQDDGVLNNTPKGTTKYGHSTTIKKDGLYYILDNYKGILNYNKIKVNDLDSLIREGIIYEWAYLLFVDEDEKILQIKKQIMSMIKLESAKKFVARGYTNGEKPELPITREELWAILERVLVANNLK